MKYIFKETIEDKESTSGFKFVDTEITPERWCWGVVYKDGSELHQFDNKGIFHQIKEIKMENVKLFSMYKLYDIKKRIDLVVMPDMQIFHFYRNIKPYYSDKFIKVYVFGYKIRGTSKTNYTFILPDDRIIIANKDNISLEKFELNR